MHACVQDSSGSSILSTLRILLAVGLGMIAVVDLVAFTVIFLAQPEYISFGKFRWVDLICFWRAWWAVQMIGCSLLQGRSSCPQGEVGHCRASLHYWLALLAKFCSSAWAPSSHSYFHPSASCLCSCLLPPPSHPYALPRLPLLACPANRLPPHHAGSATTLDSASGSTATPSTSTSLSSVW